MSLLLLCYGVASLTTSLYVVAAAGLACAAYWLSAVAPPEEEKPDIRAWMVLREGALLVGLVLALLILYAGRGVLPF
jgi:hypothetical protein